MGGDITYSLDDPEYSGYVDFLHKLVDDSVQGINQVWMSGNASEPRPVTNLTETPEEYPCLTLNSGATETCDMSARLYAVCALPPWPGEAYPDCPPVRFDEYGLAFPETAPGLTVRQPCGPGYSGSASYTCSLEGQWSTPYPDLS